MTRQFKIKENGFAEIRNKMLWRAIPMMLIAGLGGMAISYFNTNQQSTDVNVWPFVIPIFLAAGAYGIISSIKRQKKIFDSYVLTIDENTIIREQNITPTISIPLEEINGITKQPNGAYIIKGTSSVDMIGIPVQIENMDELELLLSDIKEITINDKKSFTQKYIWASVIITLGLMAAVYTSSNKILVGFSGTILTIGLLYTLVTTQRSKHIDRKTKRGMWIVLILIFSIVSIMYYKLTGEL